MIQWSSYKSRALAAGLFIALTLIGGLTAPVAFADDAGLPPPLPVQVMDQNMMSLTQDKIFAAVPLPSVTIGQKDQGALEYHTTLSITGSLGVYTAAVIVQAISPDTGASTFTVSQDGRSEIFGPISYTSGPFGPLAGSNFNTLSFDGTTYTYLLKDGTVSTFIVDPYGCSSFYYTCAVGAIQQTTYPNGEVRDYVVRLDTDFVGLVSIKSSLGYEIKADYQCDTRSDPCYYSITTVQAINNGYDWCDPTGSDCTGLTYSWPLLTNGSTSGPPAALTITDALGKVTQLQGGTTGPLDVFTKIVRPTGATIAYHYQSGCSYCDPTLASVFDGASSTAWGYVVGFNDSLNYNEGLVTDPLGHQRRILSTKENGVPVEVINDYGGANITTTYDVPYESTVPTGVTFPEGNHWDYHYDSRGNITQIDKHPKSGSSDPVIYEYASYPTSCTTSTLKICNKPTSVTDGNGNVTTYTYDATHGGVLTELGPVVNGGQSFTQYTYTAMYAWYKTSTSSTLVQDTRPVYKLTQVSKCRLTSGKWNASGTANANLWGGLVWSPSTMPSCTGSSQELVTTYTYETGSSSTPSNLLQLSVSTAAGSSPSSAITTSKTYDKYGNVATTTGALPGQTSYFFYDADRRQTGAIQPAPDDTASGNNPATRTTYDDDGNVIKVEQGTTTSATSMDSFSPLSQTTTVYDTGYFPQRTLVTNYMGYVSGVAQPVSATQYSYDAARNPQCTAIREDMSVLGSLPGACTKTTPGPNGTDQISQQNFDAANRLVSTQQGIDSGHVITTRTNTYAINPTTMLGTPDIATVADANNNLTSYAYDGHNRLSQMNFPSTTTPGTSSTSDYEAYCYDKNGNKTQLWLRNNTAHTVSCSGTNAAGSIFYQFDAMNRMTVKIIGTGGSTDVYYSYDLLGDLLSAQFGSLGGQGVTYTYDAWGRKLTETAYGRTTTSQYDAAGNRTQLTYPDGVNIQYTYDVLNRMETAKQGSTTLASYTYDDLLRAIGIGRPNMTATSISYSATSLDRSLTQDMAGTSQDVTYAMTFTPAPQLASRNISNSAYAYSAPNLTTSYCANGLNQYVASAGSCSGAGTFTYDDRGNLTSDGSRTMSYDLENRLTGVSGSASATLTYDPKGRLQTYASASPVQFQYDGDEMLAEYDSTGTTVLRRYVPGAGTDETLVWYDGADLSTPNWLHTDEQGTTIATSNSSGVATTYNYSPTGEPTSWAGARIRYTGQAILSDITLYYYKARMYDPKLGRFLQTDPVGYSDDMNLYAYVGNDPVNKADPNGDEAACVTLGGNCGIDPQTFSDNVGAVANALGKAADNLNYYGSVLDGVPPQYGGPLEAAGLKGAGAVLSVIARGVRALEETEDVARAGKAAETANAARREVMRDAKIPTSQQPIRQGQTAAGRYQEYSVPKKGGGTETRAVVESNMDRSHPGERHYEAGPVKTDPITGETRYNQHGAPQLQNGPKCRISVLCN